MRARPTPHAQTPHAWAGAALAAACLLLAGACGGQRADEVARGRGILLIAVDALRWDHLELNGYDRRTSPCLIEFAGECVTFDSAWSTGADVAPSHISLLTGCDPLLSKSPRVPLADGTEAAPAFSWTVPEAVPNLALELLADGWDTAAFVDHPRLSGLRGFERGFHEFHEFGGADREERPVFGFQGVARRFVDWLHDVDVEQDWFAYVHMSDLERMWGQEPLSYRTGMSLRGRLDYVLPVASSEHAFHALPRSRASERQRSLAELEAIYDTALGDLDRNLERLLTHVRAEVDWDNTTVVLVGTYGMALGEGGLYLTAGGLTAADLHVPLLVRPAPRLGIPVGVRSNALASLTDIAPTLLELAQVARPSGMHGVSLNGPLRGRAGGRERTFAMGGLYEGLAAVEDGQLYSLAWPALRHGAVLGRSWYGTRRVDKRSEVEELFAGVADGRLEAVPPGPERAARCAELRAQCERWLADLERARAVLHLWPWDRALVRPGVVAELQARGVLGDVR